MSEDRKELEGPGVATPDPEDLEQHPDAQQCECGHPLRRHGKVRRKNKQTNQWEEVDMGEGPNGGPLCERSRFCRCQGFKRASMELVVTKPEHQKEYELIRQMGNLPARDWPDARILAVRQMYAASANSSAQLAVFLSVAGKHMLDPALNEVQLIQTDKGPKVYAGRDGFLRSASLHPEMYGGIQSGVVYEQDVFLVKVYADAADPTRTLIDVRHEWDPRKRKGRPHGAYCIVFDAKDRPTYVYRETRKCENLKSFYWKDETVDDAIHNRAIAAGLRRVIPLGGLLIHGEEPIGGTTAVEDEVSKGTRRKLEELRATLVGDPEPEDEEYFHVDEAGHPDPEELEEALEALCEEYRVPIEAVAAWAEYSGSMPDNPEEWGDDEKVIILQELRASEGLDFIKAYAEKLANVIDHTVERLDVLGAIVQTQDRAELDEIITRLLERRT